MGNEQRTQHEHRTRERGERIILRPKYTRIHAQFKHTNSKHVHTNEGSFASVFGVQKLLLLLVVCSRGSSSGCPNSFTCKTGILVQPLTSRQTTRLSGLYTDKMSASASAACAGSLWLSTDQDVGNAFRDARFYSTAFVSNICLILVVTSILLYKLPVFDFFYEACYKDVSGAIAILALLRWKVPVTQAGGERIHRQAIQLM